MEQQDVEAALVRARGADPGMAMASVAPVLEAYRGRIERMLRLRMDHRVAGRVGVSDVMQDAYLEIARRLPQYLEEDDGCGESERGAMPFFLWVRFLAGQALRQTHRKHLGTVARDAGREVQLQGARGVPEASSLMLVQALVESGASPSGVAVREEQREALGDALDSLSPEDREVLFMRHFEQLSNGEIASALGLSAGGASLRHLKALGRLQQALARFGIRFDAAADG